MFPKKKKKSLHKNGKGLEEPTSLLHMSHQAFKYLFWFVEVVSWFSFVGQMILFFLSDVNVFVLQNT